ncbi:MAG: hypothetical protein GY801_52460 [bacterium]|nr:hypothetical protein [bacterium]
MKKDLVVLVADKNAQFVLDGLLPRHQAFRIAPMTYDVYIHPHRDPGVYRASGDFLRPFQQQYRYALILLDREGSGQEQKTAEQIATEIKATVENNGWGGRAEAISFDPELEIWAWVQSSHLATCLGWDKLSSLHDYVQIQGYWQTDQPKPQRPKEAFEAALKEKRIQRSSAIYKDLASKASFRDCREPSFLKFKNMLQRWFPA